MLDEILLPGFEVEFIVENRPLARRLHEAGIAVTVGDPRRTDTWLACGEGAARRLYASGEGGGAPRGRRAPPRV